MTIRELVRLVHVNAANANHRAATTALAAAATDFCCAMMSNDVWLRRSSDEFVIYTHSLFVLDWRPLCAPCALASVARARSLKRKFRILNIIYVRNSIRAHYKSFSCPNRILSRTRRRPNFAHISPFGGASCHFRNFSRSRCVFGDLPHIWIFAIHKTFSAYAWCHPQSKRINGKDIMSVRLFRNSVPLGVQSSCKI